MTPQKDLVIHGNSPLFRKKFGPSIHCVGEHSEEHRRCFKSTFDAKDCIWLTAHICVCPTAKFSHHRVASKAKRSRKKFVMVLTGCVVLLNQEAGSPTKQTPSLFQASGQSACRLNWLLAHHDDASGTA
jgi:hypothetical protein